jgi:2-keto-4-pentenoate hydratase/2-oxohepta-3-ene-1,7-dioic acid hydratase in catechol pathway
MTVPLAQCRLLPPAEPTKILGIGRNYAAHAAEMGVAPRTVPSVFLKPVQSLVPHGGNVVLPQRNLSTEVHHEGELAVVIGRRARHVKSCDAAAYVLGLTCANDVSARDIQQNDPQITRAKGFDTFCPLGPHIETDASITAHRDVTCTVNGTLRQAGNTREFLHDIPTLIEFLSAWTTLSPGDVILTGSPAGTGPMSPGDDVEVCIDGVGTLRHGVVSSPLDQADDPSGTSAEGVDNTGKSSR